MHAASPHPSDDADIGNSVQPSIDDASRRMLSAVEQRPSDEPPPEVHEAPGRQPIIGFFTGHAFFSKETGRWQRLAGAPNHDDEAGAERAGEGGD